MKKEHFDGLLDSIHEAGAIRRERAENLLTERMGRQEVLAVLDAARSRIAALEAALRVLAPIVDYAEAWDITEGDEEFLGKLHAAFEEAMEDEESYHAALAAMRVLAAGEKEGT